MDEKIGYGEDNTSAIVSHCQITGVVTAAQAAYDAVINGYSDWYLPSIKELEEMYNTIGPESEANIGGFETSDIPHYWSSTNHDIGMAKTVYFNTGIRYGYVKKHFARVRAVRSF